LYGTTESRALPDLDFPQSSFSDADFLGTCVTLPVTAMFFTISPSALEDTKKIERKCLHLV